MCRYPDSLGMPNEGHSAQDVVDMAVDFIRDFAGGALGGADGNRVVWLSAVRPTRRRGASESNVF